MEIKECFSIRNMRNVSGVHPHIYPIPTSWAFRKWLSLDSQSYISICIFCFSSVSLSLGYIAYWIVDIHEQITSSVFCSSVFLLPPLHFLVVFGVRSGWAHLGSRLRLPEPFLNGQDRGWASTYREPNRPNPFLPNPIHLAPLPSITFVPKQCEENPNSSNWENS